MTAQQRMLLGSFQEDISGCTARINAGLKKAQTNTKPTSYSLAVLGSEARKLGELALGLSYWAGVISGQEGAGKDKNDG